MSAATQPSKPIDLAGELNLATVGDYFALLKPRVMSLVLFTGIAGLVLAPGTIHIATALTALLAIAVGAGASGALNMAYDADIDRLMSRTRSRPVPRGAIPAGDAAAFGTTLAVGAVTVMGLFVNLVAAALLAFTIVFYVLVYTAWLKRSTPQNIVIGGLAGALPPAIGWAVGDLGPCASSRSCSSPSSSCGRRRISGRCRSIARTIMRGRACRCCPWSRARARRAVRS